MKKLSKSARVRKLVAEGKLTPAEIAKKADASINLVYAIRWQMNKTKKHGSKTAKKTKAKKAAKKSNGHAEVASLPTIEEIDALIEEKEAYEAEKRWEEVNEPPHYIKGGVETIDFIEAKELSFNLGNVVKYISRAGVKDPDVRRDLEKARWYLNREIGKYLSQGG